jgi:hypothetical protein
LANAAVSDKNTLLMPLPKKYRSTEGIMQVTEKEFRLGSDRCDGPGRLISKLYSFYQLDFIFAQKILYEFT